MGEMKQYNIQENMLEVISIKDNVYLRKQVEFKDGKTYMRIKKRVLIGNS
jgi:hypothetical protein